MKKTFRIKRLIAAAGAAAILTALAASGVLYGTDSALADKLYQREAPAGDIITILKIDQKSLDELGPFSGWGRKTMAEVIRILNSDPENAPAVIGVDVLYTGESEDSEGDEKLAAAAGEGGNVVVACAAAFGSEISEDGASFTLNNHAVTALDLPYRGLYEAADSGHINAMFDKDGILRHGLYEVELPDGSVLPSFSSVISRKYRIAMGLNEPGRPPVDAAGRFYVSFTGGPGAYDDGYSVCDLLNGGIDPAVFAGKIVLIGPYAPGMQDDFPTAADHAEKMYGIEYQANLINMLLNENVRREVALGPQMIFLYALSFLLLLLFIDRSVRAATLLWLASSVGYIGICLAACRGKMVLKPLYLPLSATVLYVGTVALNYVRAAVEKRRVTKTFERYVAPEIVLELLKEDSSELGLGGKLCDIAVLFVDIRGFTTMSEQMSPPEIVEILNRYLTLTSSCIFKNNGTLDKFVGDCTMAFWGAPLKQDDCIFKAVKTALDMVAGARELEKELEARYGRSVGFGVGVNFGPAVVGNIGSPSRMDYTAIGDTVNTAARLEANAPAGQILVSRAVADALSGRVAFISLGSTIQLKGKAEGFEILRVEGLIEKGNGQIE